MLLTIFKNVLWDKNFAENLYFVLGTTLLIICQISTLQLHLEGRYEREEVQRRGWWCNVAEKQNHKRHT